MIWAHREPSGDERGELGLYQAFYLRLKRWAAGGGELGIRPVGLGADKVGFPSPRGALNPKPHSHPIYRSTTPLRPEGPRGGATVSSRVGEVVPRSIEAVNTPVRSQMTGGSVTCCFGGCDSDSDSVLTVSYRLPT